MLARCLVRDPKLRLRDIGEARLALSDRPRRAGCRHSSRDSSKASRPLWPILAGGLALALAVTGFALWRVATAPSDAPVTRFEVRPPDKASLVLVGRPGLALSPDGSMMAFVASAEGISRLYLRSLADIAARPLPGTEGGSNPVFSPSGTEIAFYAAGRLKKTTLDGTVTTVTEAGGDGDPRGITWLPDGSLVYASLAVGPLLHVPSAGGTPRPLTTLDEKKSERTHRWPSALPGGKAVLFTVGTIASPDNYDRSPRSRPWSWPLVSGTLSSRAQARRVMSAPDISSVRARIQPVCGAV